MHCHHDFGPALTWITERKLEAIYYTLIAGALYVASNWVLDRVEIKRGRRFTYRSIIFFFIMLALVFVAFSLLNMFLQAPPQ